MQYEIFLRNVANALQYDETMERIHATLKH